MSKIIKIQIIHSLAINSAKNDTFQKGVVDKAVDQKLVTAAYHEQAGNETYHEIMLKRFLFTQIEVLKTKLAIYLTGGGNIAEDATVDSTEENDMTEIMLSVSERFNNGLVKSLARLSQKFVEDRMIHLWWVPVSKEFAALYEKIADDDLQGVIACFNKTAPVAPHYKYPVAIELRYPIIPERNNKPGVIYSQEIEREELFANPWHLGCGQTSEISYTLEGEDGQEPHDDIVVTTDNKCCMYGLNTYGKWYLKGVTTGYAIIKLFSRHNDNVFAKFAVRIV